MYPHVIHIDELLYEAGESMELMAIISRGELRAEIEVSDIQRELSS